MLKLKHKSTYPSIKGESKPQKMRNINHFRRIFMLNIHEILKDYGITIPEDKKSDFDKAIVANYKTVVEVDKLKTKLEKAEADVEELKGTLETTNTAFEELKNSNASAEDWKAKYESLEEENRIKEENRAKEEAIKNQRADFDNYFAENNKEWANPLIADGYFIKYQEAIELPENKHKTTGEIAHNLTKDDATAFKTSQPIVTLKGAAGGLGGNDNKVDLPTIF